MARLYDIGIFSANATNGQVGVGYKLNFYITGTSTRKATYPTRADAVAGTNANANPVVAAADGRWAPIWLTGGEYKVVLTDIDDVTLETLDPGEAGGSANDLDFSHATSYSVGTVGAALEDRAVNVKDAPYSATGDGTTNDKTAIQAALDSGALYVEMTAATYISSTGLTIPANVTLDMKGATIKVPVGINAITMSSKSKLINGIIDGTSVDDVLGASGIILNSDGYLANVTVQNFGFQGFASVTGGSDRNILVGCRAYNVGHRGINLSEGSTQNRVTNFEARDCLKAGVLVGYLSNYNIFSDVFIDGFSAASGGAGLWVHMNSDYNEFSNFQIGAQKAAGGTTAPHLLLGAASKFNTFRSFKLYSVGTRGVYVWNQNTDNPSLGTSDTPVEGNRFSDFDIIGTSAASSDGLSFKSDNSEIIQNNIFSDFYITGFVDAVEDLDVATVDLEFRNFKFGTISGRKMKVGSTADNFRTGRRRNCDGLTGVGSLAISLTEYGAQPAVPATGVTQSQYYPFPVNIYVQGMPAGSNVLIDGTNILGTAPSDGNLVYTVMPEQTIALSYASGTPTWRWWGLDW